MVVFTAIVLDWELTESWIVVATLLFHIVNHFDYFWIRIIAGGVNFWLRGLLSTERLGPLGHGETPLYGTGKEKPYKRKICWKVSYFKKLADNRDMLICCIGSCVEIPLPKLCHWTQLKVFTEAHHLLCSCSDWQNVAHLGSLCKIRNIILYSN